MREGAKRVPQAHGRWGSESEGETCANMAVFEQVKRDGLV